MSKALRVLHDIEDLALEAVVVGDDQEADDFLSCTYVIDTCRHRIHGQLLSHLADTVSHETVNLLIIVSVFTSLVLEVRLAWWDTILVDKAVA